LHDVRWQMAKMRLRMPSFLWIALLGVAACGGALADPSLVPDAGHHMDAGHDPSMVDQMSGGVPRADAATMDAFPVYVEDACTDAPLEIPPLECDPFAANPCPQGRACYPIPPHGTDACHPGRYGTMCLREGIGGQGAPCNDGTDCAGGFLCVKTGIGDMCVKLCKLDQFGSCMNGRICREVDVTGSEWGGCE
jgi:hypothetical protein